MDEASPLAIFLKQHREARGLNPRQFAEAIKLAGGKATTQAVQQWENTTPGQRTTRPNIVNRRAIAKVLDCDPREFDSAYRAAREMADASATNEAPPSAGRAQMRTKLTRLIQCDSDITDALRAKIPESVEYLEKTITPFGMSRLYDYLSPRLAADWVGVRSIGSSSASLEGHLWHLLWLSRLDADTGVARKYLFILVIASDDPEAVVEIKTKFERLRDEARVFGNTLTLCLASSPEEAADLIVAHETGA